MRFSKEDGKECLHYPNSFFSTDFMLQQSHTVTDNVEMFWKLGLFFWREQKLHGFRTEAFVVPNGIFISFLKHCKGGDSETSTFRHCLSMHKILQEKRMSTNALLMLRIEQRIGLLFMIKDISACSIIKDPQCQKTPAFGGLMAEKEWRSKSLQKSE